MSTVDFYGLFHFKSIQPFPENTSATDFYAQIYKELAISKPKGWKYFSGDSLHKAYWRTIFCDSIGHSRIISRQSRYEWREYVRKVERKLMNIVPKTLISVSSRAAKESYDRRMGRSFHELESNLPCNSSYNFCTTAQDYFAIVPCEALSGDLVCALAGGHVPYILRRVAQNHEEDSVVLIGPAYVHGFMDGRILELRDKERFQQELFTLI
ncbi:hypothetical protein F5884DRAFT_319968 [Xylogone sp. PMI_703]|nr:hypothetical protein F5884DRAFT_319968 [Xylogone sp. PMI_703]